LLETNHRHLGETQLPRRQQPAVAGEDAALLVHEHRVRPAEFDHRSRDLVHLRLAVRPRVPLVRAQALDWPELDPVRERDQAGAVRRRCHRALQSRYSHLTIATMAAPIATTARASSRRQRRDS
jgi:hypothetical protein